EADQLVAIKDELARARILAQLPVLEELDRQIVRIDFRFDVRAERREGVERLRTGPLAFTVLNGAVADVLRRSVAQDIAGGGRWGNVTHTPANDDGQLGLKIGAVIGKRDFDFPSVGNQRGAGLDPK